MTNLQLLVIEGDPIFRLGLRVACEQYPDLGAIAEVESGTEAVNAIAALGDENTPDVVIWILDGQILLSEVNEQDFSLGMTLCEQLKTQYPNLPLLLLVGNSTPALLARAKQAGVDGYCPKAIAVAELVAAIRLVASGESYWPERSQEQENEGNIPLRDSVQVEEQSELYPNSAFSRDSLYRKLIAHLSRSGMRQIDTAIAEVNTQLQDARLLQKEDFASLSDWVLLSGRRRELLAARWLVSQLLPTDRQQKVREHREEISNRITNNKTTNSPSPIPNLPTAISNSELSPQFSATNDLQAALFKAVAAKLESGLVNLTGLPLEIDIFRLNKKQDLMYIILRKLQNILDELRFSQVELQQLSEKRSSIVRDLWQETLADFFGKYYTLRIEEGNVGEVRNTGELTLQKRSDMGENPSFVLPPSSLLFSDKQERIEVVPVLLQETQLVETAILDKIPLVVECFAHLLYQTPLIIDNISCSAGSPEAMVRAQVMLENLVIQLANGVVQPLLNNFADLEEIKQKFYDRQLISTREIEKFRNNLSWKYRMQKLFWEPQAIFESRFLMLTLNEIGIQKTSIYSPRNQELAQLSGVQLVVTLVLELRDAIAPRLRAIIAFLGTGVVYLLTQVIGRGIGLVGRGILQGVGNSLQDSKWEKKGD
ncbi:DUF3685 domain-containing protein [Kamptonema animale CS-326]|jgi:DNA-binding NarL/FixJ family response regulator|uniref:DUF3685 domain-containing protein n=1 Tax=Kamptonema animale TaxID=92934 RepID=UPI002330CB17|nr:DUF3685 domain-containing protein [Kamptonema animale]MDB9509770.1 DUF3685 domain-containing protein [Kamptonema animale CS-326]